MTNGLFFCEDLHTLVYEQEFKRKRLVCMRKIKRYILDS